MNSGSVKDILLIGLDGAMYHFIEELVKEDLLPNICRLMDEGVYGEALPCPPTDTPTNWTTIATGSSTATHGVTSFYIHIPGEPYELGQRNRSRGQLRRYCKAEYIWDIADRYGIRSLVLNYPAGWPGGMRNGYVCLYTWPMPESVPRILAGARDYTLEKGVAVEPFRKDIESAYRFRLKVEGGFIDESEAFDLYLTRLKDSSEYRLAIPRAEDYELIKPGRWSDWIEATFKIVGSRSDVQMFSGFIKGIFKLKFLEASENRLKIQVSEIYSTRGWMDPGGLERDTIAYTHYLADEESILEYGRSRFIYDISGMEAEFLARQRIEAYRLARITKYLRERIGWHLCFLHYHIMDSVNHRFLGLLDPKFPFYDEEKARYAWRYFIESYKIIDEFIGLLLESCATPDTLIIVVSDHAAIPAWRVVNIRRIFINEGLLSYKASPDGYLVDWSRTKAFPWIEPLMVWINLVGRDPNGIVEAKDYEDLREQVVDILQNLRDPDTGRKITAMVLRREESVNIGLGDERTGDIVYFLKPPYTIWHGPTEDLLTYKATEDHLKDWLVRDQSRITGIHGYYLPNERMDRFSNTAIFIMNGPHVKKGEKLKKPIRLTDIAPTISYLLGIPVPRDCEGRVIYEALI
ncbi:MAG: alkaline phosphatase family protein [Candidatus Bathyarchaeia archaeon]|nr:alkaline phosphatase family protein [Candidatus Bathyarchaeota archaeon]